MCLCIHDTCSRVCVCLFTACCTMGRFVCIWWIMHRHIETDSIGVRKRNSRLYSYALLCSGGLVFVVVDLNGSSVWRCIYVCVCCRCLGPMHSVVDIRLALWPIGDALHTHSYRMYVMRGVFHIALFDYACAVDGRCVSSVSHGTMERGVVLLSFSHTVAVLSGHLCWLFVLSFAM